MAESADQLSAAGNGARRRRWFWMLIALSLAIGLFIAVEIVAHRVEPVLKARVADALSEDFDSRVQLASFHVSITHGLHVFGGGLVIYPRLFVMHEPMLAVKQFSFYTPWKQLFHQPMHIEQVDLSGLVIHIPTTMERNNSPQPQRKGAHNGGGVVIIVNRLASTDARLIIDPNKPGSEGLQFDIRKLQLTTVAPHQPLKFRAVLINPKPVGNVQSSGVLGPFRPDDPGETPVRGTYWFRNADLGTLNGIAGTLSSQGNYEGTLQRINVDGKTVTPNFRLEITGRPVPLNTTFHAIVDGTNSDTCLQSVVAQLLDSRIVAKGDLVRVPGRPGHDIQLNVIVGPAQIQDLLALADKREQPLMTGAVRLHTSFQLPPGPQPVIGRLKLTGSFSVEHARFTDAKFQAAVDEISMRGQGKPKKAKQARAAAKLGDPISAPGIVSQLSGNFSLGAGTISFSYLSFSVPGADVVLHGIYTTQGEQLDFHGFARLDAKLPKMFTGWKSILLRPLDPFFYKRGRGTQIPIRVSGTRADPHFGLDLGI